MSNPIDFPEGDLVCQRCGAVNAAKQRQNTQYSDDSANWVTLCPPCAAENEEYWAEMWRDYYSGRL